jgi:trans-aconitate 2-methyltransferase
MLEGMSDSAWDPVQYERFAAERRRPFDDLMAGLEPVPGGTAVDLGCGPGTLTIDLHRYLQAAQTIGIDDAEPMLVQARARLDDPTPGRIDGVAFEWGHLQDWAPERPVDVVFANASLQWVPNHPALLAQLAGQLVGGGQLAFQVPANHDHPSHQVADDLGRERGLTVTGGAANVLAPETYATVLHDLGQTDVDVRLQVYGFELERSADLVEWTKGTLLTGYRAQLDPAAYDEFVAEYRRRLGQVIGDPGPYYYAFKRILAWSRRA